MEGGLCRFSGLVVGVTEFLEAIAELVDSILRSANNHAEEAFLKEALGGESQAVLLVQKHLAELHVIADAVELFKVDAHHHVHGSAASDWRNTFDRGESQKGSLAGCCQFLFHGLKMTVWDLFEDFGEGELDERVGVQLDHGVHAQAR